MDNLQTANSFGLQPWFIPAGAFLVGEDSPAELVTKTYGANNLSMDLVSFATGVIQNAHTVVNLPPHWDGNPVKAKVIFTTETGSAIGEVVRWGLQARGITPGAAIDQAYSSYLQVDGTVTAADGVNMDITPAVSGIAAPGNTPGVPFDLKLFRYGTHANDDMPSAALLYGVMIQFDINPTPLVSW